MSEFVNRRVSYSVGLSVCLFIISRSVGQSASLFICQSVSE
jgi:hypothetical protein